MISSMFGIAIVALPAGIVTAGYMEELHEIHGEKEWPAEKTGDDAEKASAEAEITGDGCKGR